MKDLGEILRAVESGSFPDAGLTLVPAPSSRESAVVAFTGHNVIAADVTAGWLAERLPAEDLSAPLNPPFLSALEAATGRRVNGIDAVLLTTALTDPAERLTAIQGLTELTDHDHPRIQRALRYRDEVRAWLDPGGGVILTGRGLAGRLECAVEIPDAHRNRGHGRHLARAARALVPPHTHLWAQVSPGNAASLRAFLAAGFHPVGAEALLVD